MCQPKFLPETPASPEPRQASKKRKAPSVSTNRTRLLTLEELQENFHLPINEVASKLGVCVTVLKQQCRELGIVRWPFRKVRKLDNMLTALETAGPTKARPFALTNSEEERQRKITTVKKTLQKLVEDPNSCAHLKLGKVKNAAAKALPGQPCSDAFADRLGVQDDVLARLGLSLPAGAPVSPETADAEPGDASAMEAGRSLLWGPHQVRPSESAASRRQSGTWDLNLLRPTDGGLLGGESDRIAGTNGTAEQGVPLPLSLGLSQDTPVQAPSPANGVWPSWMTSLSGSISRSTSVPDKGLSAPALVEGSKDLQLTPEGYSTGPGASASGCFQRSISDTVDSAQRAHGSVAAVELDLISLLGSPNLDSSGRAEVQAELRMVELGPTAVDQGPTPAHFPQAIREAPSTLETLKESPSPTDKRAPVQQPLATSIPVPHMSPLPGPCAESACGPARIASEVLQFRSQQLALIQQHQQQQLLAFLGYPQQHMSPLVLRNAMDMVNVQRQAALTESLGLLNPYALVPSSITGDATGPPLPLSMVPAVMQPYNLC